MELLTENLKEIIRKKESVTTEFKTSQKKLPKSLFESICSMLNRNGGNIFLGVKDNGEIVGIDKNLIEIMKKEFSNLCNNVSKINPTVYLNLKEYKIDDKVILYCNVYESSTVHTTANKIYDRNEDGDYDITNNNALISNVYIRKSSTYIENKIYKFVDIERDLRKDLIARARQMAVNRNPNHHWGKCNDLEMLKSAMLYDKNIETGEEGPNLACILLFGTDNIILSALSYFKVDAILRIVDKERYDDRDDIRTNLLDTYERLIEFFKKHINDKFYLEGDKNISARDIIAREICVNLLVHREYSNPTPARLIITDDEIKTENPTKTKRIGYIDINDFTPYPKNPKIAKVFKEIGLADELGSGIKKIIKYSGINFGTIPIFKENDIFISLIPTKIKGIKMDEYIYTYILNNPKISRKKIDEYVFRILKDITEKKKKEKVGYYLRKLVENKMIENIGDKKNPRYVIVKK